MTKKRIVKRVQYWQKQLGLANWKINIEFKNYKTENKSDGWSTVACTATLPDYKEAVITFHPKRLRRVDDAVVIHEVVHVLTSEMYTFAFNNLSLPEEQTGLNYYWEQQTSELERIIQRLYKRELI